MPASKAVTSKVTQIYKIKVIISTFARGKGAADNGTGTQQTLYVPQRQTNPNRGTPGGENVPQQHKQGKTDMTKICRILVLFIGMTACAANLMGQTATGKETAREKGLELIQKIGKEYPNIHGEVEEYFKVYHESPVADHIRFSFAAYCFNNGDYSGAGEQLEMTNPRSLTREQQQEYKFKLGYCLFRSGDNQMAKSFLGKIHNGKYRTAAEYYIGYINYMEQDFGGAIPHFEAAGSDTRFAESCKYYILESKFMLKDYNYVISNGKAIYQQLGNSYRTQAARILSESYFAKNLPDEAQYYYELYAMNAEKISARDNFYSGMIAYTLKNYREAINSFVKVASPADSIGQSALYHMGQCYIQLKNKHKALESFKLASKGNFDRGIKEDAFFNYAKLSFDIGKNIAPFEEYLSKFPTSNAKWDEIHNYMGTAFLMSQEYEKAITALEKIRTPDKHTARHLQKASFLRGLQLAGSNSYTMAYNYFGNAVRFGHETGNTQLTNLASFWLAECMYRTNDFSGSLHILQKLTGNSQFRGTAEYPVAVYNTGYNHFKLGNYSSAIESFASYLALQDNRGGYTDEARVRLADSYFMNRNYSQAADTYNQIAQLESYKDLYAPLQCAVAYGLISDDIRKIDVLKKITAPTYASDKLYTQALYELGRTYVQNNKDTEATAVLEKLINNPADSLFYHKALLEVSMINANKGKYDAALGYYKQIIEDKNISEETQSALAGIENIYAQQNRQADFLAYLDKVGLSETKSASERETMLFNSAEQVFLSGNYTAALNALQQFLEKYPGGAKTSQAKFYMAESYNKLGKAEAAAQAYMQVMMGDTRQEDAFTEIATLNYAKLSFQLQKYNEAVRAYETIEQIAKLGNNKSEGTIGKMRSYYNMQDYRSALAAANEVLDLNIKNGALNREANYIKAKSFLANGDRENGSKILEALAKDPADVYGAEAAYLLIVDAYDAGEFEEVENRTFALSDSATPQTYWLAKSFIALGDSYAERDNLDQARATFESIKENYAPGQQDDVLQQVEMRLNKLAKMQ